MVEDSENIRCEIEPLLYGDARIIVTDGINVFRQWWYHSMLEANVEL